MMNIKILNKSDQEIEFELEDSNPAFANTLRRIAMSEIPTMAIEYVDFEENTSGMFDEIIAHRLGLVPLTFSRDAYSLQSECKCDGEGCSRCEVAFVLEKEGPCTVYTKDLKSTADDVQPTDGDTPIAVLLEGQKLRLEAVAQLGFGRGHIKWQAANVGYKNKPVVRTYADKDPDIEKIIDICPTDVFGKKGGSVGVVDSSKCILCMRCVEVTEEGAVYVGTDESSFLFRLESVCGLSAEDILDSALGEMEARAESFTKAVNKAVK